MFTTFLYRLHDSFATATLEAHNAWPEASQYAQDTDICDFLLRKFTAAEKKLNFIRRHIGLNPLVLLSIGWFEQMDEMLDGIVGAKKFDSTDSIFITDSARQKWLNGVSAK